MHPVLAVLDLLLLVISGAAVLAGRSSHWGWVLLLASGLWLPLNNAVLEGPTLIAVDGDHGLTVSDLVGITGAVVAGTRLWLARRTRSRGSLAAYAAVVVAVVGAGFLAALLVTDVRVDDRERDGRDGRVISQNASPHVVFREITHGGGSS